MCNVPAICCQQFCTGPDIRFISIIFTVSVHWQDSCSISHKKIEYSSNCLTPDTAVKFSITVIPPCFRIIFNGIWIWHGSEEDLCNGSKCISSNKVYTRIVRCCCFTYRTAWKHFQLSKSAPIHPHTHNRANLSGQWWQPKRLHNPIQWNIILHRNRLPTDRTSTWARHGIELCSNY